jgi:GNAT superfamily N-acetyltransferase
MNFRQTRRKQGCKSLSGGFDVQFVPQRQGYPATTAACISLATMCPAAHAVVRKARPADLAALVQCDAYAQRHASRRGELKDWLRTQSVFVAEVAQRVTGFIVLNYSFFGNGFIPLVAVSEKTQRQGYGALLMSAAEQRCKTAKLFTSTNASNLAARRLISSAGFIPSGTIENLDEDDPELVYFKPNRANRC